MRKLTDNQWEVLMHWLLTLVGGFMGTYAVLLHAGNFGSAQTGNIMEMAADLISMEWSKVLLRLIAFIIFGFGVVSAYLLTNYTKLKAGLVGRCSRINTGVTAPAGSGVGGPLSDFLLCFLSVGCILCGRRI